MEFISQSYVVTIIQTWILVDHSKFHTLFWLFYQNLVDSLRKNFTGDILYTTTTHSEKPEGSSSQER
jgi:hypothetical protein